MTGHSSVIATSRNRAGNDPIFIWNGEARARAASGEDILNATIGALMNDNGTLAGLPTVIDTLTRLTAPQVGGYAPISGLPTYREAVVQDLFGDSPLASQATAVAAPGGSGAVYAAVVNFLDLGQQMLVPQFFWGPYSEITNHSGRGLDPFTMFDEDGAFDIAGMTAAIDRHLETQGRVLLVLNFPCHNPTGYSLSQDEWAQITDVVHAAGQRGPVTVLIDAAYMEFAGPESRSWVRHVPKMLEHTTVLVAWTASKSMAQYGSRIGAIVGLHADPDELAQIDNALGYSARSTWSNCPHLGQLAVTQLLTDPDLASSVSKERAALMTLLQRRIDAFNAQASKLGLPTPRFDAGFFVSVFTPDQDATAAAMREHGVYVVPIPGAVRVAICSTPESTIERLTSALEAGLAAVR
ncbi:MAG: pyridoxal phosphate-dependent aminotransferase [Longimicrobiales bacterium]